MQPCFSAASVCNPSSRSDAGISEASTLGMILLIGAILRRLFPPILLSSPAFVRWWFSSLSSCSSSKEVVSSLKWSECLSSRFSGNTFLPSCRPIDMSFRCCKLGRFTLYMHNRWECCFSCPARIFRIPRRFLASLETFAATALLSWLLPTDDLRHPRRL